MSLVTTMLALTLVAAPTPPAPFISDSLPKKACVTPDRTGTFRVTATKTDGKHGILALLLLENIDGCLEATFVTDDKGPAAIDQLSLSSDTLKGRLALPGESAQFTLRFNGPSVAGSIVGKKQEWRIEGRKTS
jgi:hypothetical protein